MFPIKNGKQGDPLSPFNFSLEYAIRRVQVKQDGVKLNDTHQLQVYANDSNIFGGSVHTIKNADALLVASKEIGPKVNADKTKNMVMSGDRNVGRGHKIKIDNGFCKRMEEFKYLGKTFQRIKILFRKKLRAD